MVAGSAFICCGAGRPDLGVGEAEVLGPDLIRSARAPIAGEPAMVDRGDPVELRAVLRDRRPRTLENLPEFYCALPDRQRSRTGHRDQRAERLGAERRGSAAGGGSASSRLRGSQAAANTSPRRASSTASDGVEPGGARARAPSASDCSVETPTSGMPRAWPSARAVAIPIRRPVNVPGPTPTAIRSISLHVATHGRAPPRSAAAASWRASGAHWAAGRREPRARCRRRHRSARPWSPASRCRNRGSSWLVDHHDPGVAAGVLDADAGRDPAQRRDRGSSPSGHSTNVIVSGAEVVGQQVGILIGQVADPEQVEWATGTGPGSAGRS